MRSRADGLWEGMSVEATTHGVCAVRLEGASPGVGGGADRLVTEALGQLREYLRGERTRFDLALDLSAGTTFGRSVWEALLAVPFGETVSYGELAAMVGCRSARAVGQAVGANPLPILVPCHRVVTSDGRLGGYSSGLDRKVALLGIEGIGATSTSFRSRIAAAA